MTLSRADRAVPDAQGSSGSAGTQHRADSITSAVFADPQSRSLGRLLERIALTDVPVLIAGEAGTGKEHLARHVHERSGRGGDFIIVQCGQATDVSGEWDRGTAFFDDVGDLSPSLQSELLGLLRNAETAVQQGGPSAACRVRIIAATSTDLGDAAAKGRFRRDLLYRLNPASVKLLPLRQRPGDIVPLANHFLRSHSENGNLAARVLGHDAMSALCAYPWPGNVRELENVIRFALLTAPRREISAADLRIADEHGGARVAAADASPKVAESTRDRLAGLLALLLQSPGRHLLDDVEGLLVKEAFRATGGNQVHTATLLGISRNVVRTLLQKHGLLRPRRRAPP